MPTVPHLSLESLLEEAPSQPFGGRSLVNSFSKTCNPESLLSSQHPHHSEGHWTSCTLSVCHTSSLGDGHSHSAIHCRFTELSLTPLLRTEDTDTRSQRSVAALKPEETHTLIKSGNSFNKLRRSK